MDIIEYAEKVCGRELSKYEKMFLRFYDKLPRDAVLIMGRYGRPIWLDKNGNILNPRDYMEKGD